MYIPRRYLQAMYIPWRYLQFSLLEMLLVIISEWSTVDIKGIVAYPRPLTVADSLAHLGDKWPAFICYFFRKLLGNCSENVVISSPKLWFSTSHHFLILVKGELRHYVSRPQCCRSSAGSTTRNTNYMHPLGLKTINQLLCYADLLYNKLAHFYLAILVPFIDRLLYICKH